MFAYHFVDTGSSMDATALVCVPTFYFCIWFCLQTYECIIQTGLPSYISLTFANATALVFSTLKLCPLARGHPDIEESSLELNSSKTNELCCGKRGNIMPPTHSSNP